MTQFSLSFVLLGVLAMSCSSSGFNRDAGESSRTGGVHSGGSTAAGEAIVGGTTHAVGSDHGSTSLSSAGTTNSGGAQASGGISNIGKSFCWLDVTCRHRSRGQCCGARAYSRAC